MPPSFDVVGVGLNATDTLILVSRVPRYGGKAPFIDEMISVGGQVASAVVTCQKLGLRSKYIGSVGDDERGKIQLASLRESGVDIEHVQVREGCANQSAYIIIDQSTGERTIFWHRDDCLRIDPDQITPEQITCARCSTSTDTIPKPSSTPRASRNRPVFPLLSMSTRSIRASTA